MFISFFLQCFSASKLLTSHGMGIQVLLNATEFNYLCPAIINQIDTRSCLIHTTSEKKAEIPPKTYSLQIGKIAFFYVKIISSRSIYVVLFPSIYISVLIFQHNSKYVILIVLCLGCEESKCVSFTLKKNKN